MKGGEGRQTDRGVGEFIGFFSVSSFLEIRMRTEKRCICMGLAEGYIRKVNIEWVFV